MRGLGAAAVAVVGVLSGNDLAGAAGAGRDWPQWRGPNRDGISEEAGWRVDWGSGGPRQVWRVAVGQGFSACAVSGGRVYTMGNADGQDTVWCLDAATGKEVWTHRYPAEAAKYPGPRATPTVDGESVYTLSRWGDLFCLGAADGKVR